MTVLAAFTGLLRRHTGRGDFAVATITAGRTRAELEPLVGYFTNTLIIRAAAGGDPGFGELLARTRGATLAAYDHQDLPFSLLVEALRAERPGEPPLFEVLFLLQPPGRRSRPPDAEIAAFPVEGTQAQDFALVLDLVEAGGRLIGTFSYNQALFDSTTALRWRGHLEALLAGAAADPARPLTELPLLSEGERHQVTFEWGEAGARRRRPGADRDLGRIGGRAGRPARPPPRRRHPGGERARRSCRARRGEGRARLRGPRADRAEGALRAGPEPRFPLGRQTEASREAHPRREVKLPAATGQGAEPRV